PVALRTLGKGLAGGFSTARREPFSWTPITKRRRKGRPFPPLAFRPDPCKPPGVSKSHHFPGRPVRSPTRPWPMPTCETEARPALIWHEHPHGASDQLHQREQSRCLFQIRYQHCADPAWQCQTASVCEFVLQRLRAYVGL